MIYVECLFTLLIGRDAISMNPLIYMYVDYCNVTPRGWCSRRNPRIAVLVMKMFDFVPIEVSSHWHARTPRLQTFVQWMRKYDDRGHCRTVMIYLLMRTREFLW